MNEQILIQILKDINSEGIQFGRCEISITFHDGKPSYYFLTTHRRRNINDISKPSLKNNGNH